jgi:transcriptional regulator GlxA family with amidase domain
VKPTLRKTIGILLFPEVEELDVVGPWQVLSAWTHIFPDDGYDVVCISGDGLPVTCRLGLVIDAHHSTETAPPLSVFIHPGGTVEPLLNNQSHITYIRHQRTSVALMVSVCNGALVYAKAGLLAGRPATTFRPVLQRLRMLDPSIEVRPDDRFVDAGDIVTSAGVSAGIDMALYLVKRLAGGPPGEHAKAVRDQIQYDPEPPV